MATSGNLIQVKDLVKTFESRIHALDHVSLAINQGDVVVIVGPVSYTHLTLPTTPYV